MVLNFFSKIIEKPSADSKAKKSVSSRYASVLILLTIQGRYSRGYVLILLTIQGRYRYEVALEAW